MYYKLPQLSLQICVAVFHCLVNQPVCSTSERKMYAYKIRNKSRGVCLLRINNKYGKQERNQ